MSDPFFLFRPFSSFLLYGVGRVLHVAPLRVHSFHNPSCRISLFVSPPAFKREADLLAAHKVCKPNASQFLCVGQAKYELSIKLY
jgi:hypothetical protein